MSPNNSAVFPLIKQPSGRTPKGVLMTIAINPYNHNVVIGYQDHPQSIKYIHNILEQIKDHESGMWIYDLPPHLSSFLELLKEDKALPFPLSDDQELKHYKLVNPNKSYRVA